MEGCESEDEITESAESSDRAVQTQSPLQEEDTGSVDEVVPGVLPDWEGC